MALFSEKLIFGGVYYWRNFAFQNGLGLTIKTANSNGPCPMGFKCLGRIFILSEGYLRLRFGGLIFRRAYYRNFTVFFT